MIYDHSMSPADAARLRGRAGNLLGRSIPGTELVHVAFAQLVDALEAELNPLGALTLWRCSRCGKWSTAKRRPKQHERWTREPRPGDVVIRLDHEREDGGVAVECGPFEEYRARKATP